MSSPSRIFVVDDDTDLLTWLTGRLRTEGHEVEGSSDPEEAIAAVIAHPPDLVVMDVEMPRVRGLDAMERMRAQHPGLLVLLITGFGSIELAVQGLQAGACDFVTKPFRFEQLRHAIQRALETRTLRREVVRLRTALAPSLSSGLVARSPAMVRVMSIVQRAARVTSNVLLTGETGVGKSAIAQRIHEGNPQRTGAFVAVNCGAIPGTLVESELFGVRRGAFTDARSDRRGRFEEADGGTLFLDEIAELPMDLQAKLLHALEGGAIRPLGASQEVRVDVRLVAATNQSLEAAVREGRFRSDLLYRLDVIRIHVPPLRERREDLLPLIDLLLDAACARAGHTIRGISQDALRWLLAHDWPGNVRELANALERAVVLTDHDTLVLDDFLPGGSSKVTPTHALDALVAAGWSLAEVEAAYTDRVLAFTDDNKAEAARILGIDRRTLYRQLDARKDGGEAGSEPT